jgi:hypothetical protein
MSELTNGANLIRRIRNGLGVKIFFWLGVLDGQSNFLVSWMSNTSFFYGSYVKHSQNLSRPCVKMGVVAP